MTNVQTILRGARSPRTCRLNLTPGNTGLDLTTVTGVSFDVVGPTGIAQVWAAAIDSASTASLSCHHTFDDAGAEVAEPGRYSIVATLTTPGGPHDAGPYYLQVLDR
jgi:hypothetical protein